MNFIAVRIGRRARNCCRFRGAKTCICTILGTSNLAEGSIDSESGERRGLVGVERRVFCNSHHGEDLCEMGGEPADGDGLAGLASLHQNLDDESDARGVEVFNALEVEQNVFVRGFVESVVGVDDCILRGRRDVSRKAEAGDIPATRTLKLLLGYLIH